MPQNPTSRTLIDQLQSALWNHHQLVYLTLLRGLARTGRPVSRVDVASAVGMSFEEVNAALAVCRDVEYDQTGNVVAAGLSLTPTPHRMRICGHALFAWCALDTLMYPVLLEQNAEVESWCPITGVPIRLTVTPTEITGLDPAVAVVSLVTPPPSSLDCDKRSMFCDQVHFISSSEAATRWRAVYPEATIVTVAEAYAVGHELAKRRLDRCQS